MFNSPVESDARATGKYSILELYNSYERIIKDMLSFDKFTVNKEISEKYKSIYLEWKVLKKTLDEL